MSSATALRLDLPAEPSSVREARAHVRRAVSDWGWSDLVDTATLLVSELATNVVRHARTAYAVVVSRASDGLVVDVLDDAAEVPALASHDLSADSGRGLSLVDDLADEWGPTPRGDLGGFTKGVRFALRSSGQ